MKILSLFDGMACGMLAMMDQNVPIDRYVAYEIDKHAVKTVKHNFPNVEECGDVFQADFKQYAGFDFLVGGSPCTYWSIAQTKHRETIASGFGWELFCQYVRALKEARPEYFIYENNKSMASAIRECISDTFGFEPICINSALVSAQNRQRLYWVGKYNAVSDSYDKVNIDQPNDRGVLLKDILECNAVSWLDKSHTIDATYYKGGTLESAKLHQNASRLMAAVPISTTSNGKSFAITATEYKGSNIKHTLEKHVRTMVAEPLIVNEATTKGYTEIEAGNCVDLAMPNSKTRRGRNMLEKSNCMQTSNGFYQYLGTIDKPIYEVKDGFIHVKDNKYPIKLIDGYYIIRKLTVKECMRLQTVPEWYEFPVSDSQAYKMLGNGWTVQVISHLIGGCLNAR